MVPAEVSDLALPEPGMDDSPGRQQQDRRLQPTEHLVGELHIVAHRIAGGVGLNGSHRDSLMAGWFLEVPDDLAHPAQCGADRDLRSLQPQQQQRLGTAERRADQGGDLLSGERTQAAEPVCSLLGHRGQQSQPALEQLTGSLGDLRIGPASRHQLLHQSDVAGGQVILQEVARLLIPSPQRHVRPVHLGLPSPDAGHPRPSAAPTPAHPSNRSDNAPDSKARPASAATRLVDKPANPSLRRRCARQQQRRRSVRTSHDSAS